MSKSPVRGCHVVGGYGPSVACGDLNGEALANHVSITLPVLPPVLCHDLPPCVGPHDRCRLDIAGAGHVGDQNQVPPRVAVDCKRYAPCLHAGHSVKKITESTTNQWDTISTCSIWLILPPQQFFFSQQTKHFI
ncbi:hypothetical protein RHGRI_008146 [Rhododendron griersonianum]|uniref:Uncharacterized protein n=1 Tax=Rhododendron griersonianum TaxID=479676 RepID=A0AAV6KZI2_9ERIC|nr:hypothetical protein RHGRI_008146 [Rhododendron griersonianum]